jgi:hypothetical protein
LARGGGDVSPRNSGFSTTRKLYYMHDRRIVIVLHSYPGSHDLRGFN